MVVVVVVDVDEDEDVVVVEDVDVDVDVDAVVQHQVIWLRLKNTEVMWKAVADEVVVVVVDEVEDHRQE